jgi:hypothetical protein
MNGDFWFQFWHSKSLNIDTSRFTPRKRWKNWKSVAFPKPARELSLLGKIPIWKPEGQVNPESQLRSTYLEYKCLEP